MKWDRERWRKLYCKEEGDFANLPALTRAFAALLLKYADDAGRIPIPTGEEPGYTIARLIRAHRFEYRQIGAYVTALLNDGYIFREPTAIVLRNFIRAQGRSSGAERQSRYRERHRDVTSDVTLLSREHNDVTDRALSLSSSDPDLGSLEADPREEVPVTARAGESRSRPNPIGEDVADSASLLGAVQRHEMLVSLHADRRWAERAAGGLMHQGCRAQDAVAAVDAFVSGEAANAPDGGEALDRFVRAHIGRYLKNAKQHSDRLRTQAARDADRGRRNGKPAEVQRSGWSREDAARNKPATAEGDGF